LCPGWVRLGAHWRAGRYSLASRYCVRDPSLWRSMLPDWHKLCSTAESDRTKGLDGSEKRDVFADPPTLWTNWRWPRGSVPDPQGQSRGPEGPAIKPWGRLTSKLRNCAYRPTHPGEPVLLVHRVFTWSTGSSVGLQSPRARLGSGFDPAEMPEGQCCWRTGS
jgi:hypothetical protein